MNESDPAAEIAAAHRMYDVACDTIRALTAEVARLTAEKELETRWRHQAIRYVRAIAIEDAARECEAMSQPKLATAIRALTPVQEPPP